METKRITLFLGHYGSGKTNIAVNWAKFLRQQNNNVKIVDLDIVNPYFRTKDSEEELKALGIELICSEYANTNLDIPAIPKEIYAALKDRQSHLIMDVGGDDAGAVALGRYSQSIKEENNYQMLYVVNFCRPLTYDAASAFQIMREIEAASGISFTGIINNTNIGDETTPEVVISSVKKARELFEMANIPIAATTVNALIYDELKDKITDAFSLELQNNKY